MLVQLTLLTFPTPTYNNPRSRLQNAVRAALGVYKPTHDSVFENELQERLWQAEKDKKIVRSHQSKKM